MNSKDFKLTCNFLLKKILSLENTECCLCFDKIEVGTMFLPCNHYHFCFNCANDLQNCPLCRTKVLHLVNYSIYNNDTQFYEHVLNRLNK